MLDLSSQGIIPIDTLMGGLSQVTSAYLLLCDEPTLVETGPATSAPAVHQALADHGIGPSDLAHAIFTHIHLDHAGGAGHLAQAFPNARLWIHPGVAQHLADPTRLIASAARIYGDEGLRATFGHPEPVSAGRIFPLEDGVDLQAGTRRLRPLHTPGHAGTHMAIQDLASDMVFSGDAVGVHLPGPDLFRPAAPPPEFDLEASLDSITRIATHARGSVLFAHFGPTSDVAETCTTASDTLRRWSDAVASARADQANQGLEHLMEALQEAEDLDPADLDPDDLSRLELMGSYRLNALGMERYFRKREEAQQPS